MQRLYRNIVFSERATNIVLQSWCQSSQKQYDAHIRKWLLFCNKRQADPICQAISMAVNFLASLYDEGMSYSSINLAQCALSAIVESPASAYSTFGEHPDVKRFTKGIFQHRPPLPHYCKTWDVNLVLQYIGSMGNSQELSLKDLTLKLVMLVVLTTAQRGHYLQLLDIQNMVQEEIAYTFMLNSNLKQSKPGKSTFDLVIKPNTYPHDRNLCVVNACSVCLDHKCPVLAMKSRVSTLLFNSTLHKLFLILSMFFIRSFFTYVEIVSPPCNHMLCIVYYFCFFVTRGRVGESRKRVSSSM